jgi:choice-of-anchor B domain-containing protein
MIPNSTLLYLHVSPPKQQGSHARNGTPSALALVLGLFLVFAFGEKPLQAQNLDLVGSLSYTNTLSDIWGWVDGSGHEYALVGVRDGLSIVDVSTDPANPSELFFIGGPSSTWRDIKTWGNYAYVIHDNVDPGSPGAPGTGLVIVDLSNLPSSIDTVTKRFFGGLNLSHSHNVFLDENGILYVCGYMGIGGVAMLDLTLDPEDPQLVGEYPAPYVHDLFVRGDTMWTAEIYNGEFGIVDVSNKAAPVVLNKATTPTAFAHNLWLSDDGATLFTTDEVPAGYIGAFDVSDISDVSEIDRQQSSPGTDVIPHNAFVYGDHLVTSYYRDGVTIHDISRPANMVEVGRYDTSPLDGVGFDGCWGVYPYTPSGLVYATDVLTGFFVLQPTYVQAAWLEGTVSSSAGGTVFGAKVEILGLTAEDESDLFGFYGTGADTNGSYDVRISATGYATKIETGIALTPGVVTNLDVVLDPLPTVTVSGTVYNADGSAGVPQAMVRFEHPEFSYETLADANGNYSIDSVFGVEYEVLAGAWNWIASAQTVNVAGSGGPIDFNLEAGIYDGFDFDFGWNSLAGTWLGGSWERGQPEAFDPGYGVNVTPGADADDVGSQCFVTGNDNANDFVHAGSATMRSPPFDPRSLDRPTLRFSAWMFNANILGANSTDLLIVRITEGSNVIVLDTIRPGTPPLEPQWREFEYELEDFTALGPDMRVFFIAQADGTAGDPASITDVLEAGIDHFRIEKFDQPSGIVEPVVQAATLFPNPNKGAATIRLKGVEDGHAELSVYGLTGRAHGVYPVAVRNGEVRFEDRDLHEGMFLYELQRQGQVLARGRFQVAR